MSKAQNSMIISTIWYRITQIGTYTSPGWKVIDLHKAHWSCTFCTLTTTLKCLPINLGLKYFLLKFEYPHSAVYRGKEKDRLQIASQFNAQIEKKIKESTHNFLHPKMYFHNVRMRNQMSSSCITHGARHPGCLDGLCLLLYM